MQCLKRANVLYPPFPTPIERRLLDLPLDDEDFAIPSFDSFHPITNSRAPAPQPARGSAPATVSPSRRAPPFFDGVAFVLGGLCWFVLFGLIIVAGLLL